MTDPQNYEFPYHWTYYLTILILTLLALLVATATLRKVRGGWTKGFALQDNWAVLTAKR